MMTLDPFLVAISQQMQPEGRAQHQAAMLAELLPRVPDDVPLADLVAGWQILARPHDQHDILVLWLGLKCLGLKHLGWCSREHQPRR